MKNDGYFTEGGMEEVMKELWEFILVWLAITVGVAVVCGIVVGSYELISLLPYFVRMILLFLTMGLFVTFMFISAGQK